MVEEQKKTPEQLLAMLSTRATFTDTQKSTILGWKPQQAANAADNKE